MSNTAGTQVPGVPGAAPAAPASTGNIFSSTLTGSPAGSSPGNTSSISSTPATGTGSQINTPTAATSPYYYQGLIIGAQNVEIGPVFAELLGLPAGAYSGARIMQAYFDMPLANAVQLQTLLNNAGYYTKASSGAALQRQEAGDIHSVVAQDAMALAIQDAVNQQNDLSTIVVNAASSGIGAQENAQALAPIVGGGNTYQVNTISGDTAYAALTAAFQSALGRNPTSAEISNFASAYNAQIVSYQQAQNTQRETMAQKTYQAQIASRDVTHGLSDIPPAGGIPAASDPYSAAAAILAVMGDQATASNIQAVAAIINATGGFTANSTSLLGITPPNATGGASLIEAAANLISNGKYEKLNLALAAGTGAQAMSDQQVQGEVTQLTGGTPVEVSATPTEAAVQAANIAAGTARAPVAAQPAIPAQMSQAGVPGSGIAGPPLSQAPTSVQNALAGAPGSGFAGPPMTQAPASVQAAAGIAAPAATPGTPLQQTNPGQYLQSPGDTYIPSTTLTAATPPTAQEAALTTAETGANAVPYLGNQFLQAYQTVLNYIKGEF